MTSYNLYNSSAFGTTIQDNLTILMDLDQNVFGPTSPKVKRAVRHLCGLTLPGEDFEPINFDNFDLVARSYYQAFQSDEPSSRNLVIFLAYLSGFFHEIRHAHDLLSTTYGQDFLFLTLNLYQNTPALLAELQDLSTRRSNQPIPLPLKDHFHEFADLPENLTQVLAKYNDIQEGIRSFQRPRQRTPSNLTVTHLLEGSAVDIQLDFIHDLFGQEAYDLFVQFIQNGARSHLYLQIRQELKDIFFDRGFRGIGLGKVINYLAWCSLVGTTLPGQKLQEAPNSIFLFQALVEFISRKLKSTSQVDIGTLQEIILGFYEHWGFLSPKEMRTRITQHLSDRLERVEKAYASSGVQNSILDITKAYRAFTKSHEYINTLIDVSPESYFGQRIYSWSIIRGLLPSVHLKVKMDGKPQDFMSVGQSVIEFDDWNYFYLNSSLFKFLMEGRSLSTVTFLDNLLYNLIAERFPVEDRSVLFQW